MLRRGPDRYGLVRALSRARDEQSVDALVSSVLAIFRLECRVVVAQEFCRPQSVALRDARDDLDLSVTGCAV